MLFRDKLSHGCDAKSDFCRRNNHYKSRGSLPGIAFHKFDRLEA